MSDQPAEMTALMSLSSIAGVIALCEELRRVGLLDEAGTSRIEQAMHSTSQIQEAPHAMRRQLGMMLDLFFKTARERTPVAQKQ